MTGTSGSQTFSLPLNLEFEDFTLTASPSANTVQAGGTAGYYIFVNPLFGFNQQVQLGIYSTSPVLPNPTYSWTPTSQPTPNGTSPSQTTLSIGTVLYVPITTHAPPRFPNGKLPPLIFGLLCLAGLLRATRR